MRLHALTISGFGPFAAAEYLDFDRLSAEGLFLFCGPTGAGKTSILDAVAFALYGTLPGARAATRSRLRSDHAQPETPTFVELVCTLGQDTVRLRRSPEYERPKRTGRGTTLQRHKVTLEHRRPDGTWVGHTDKADAVGDFVLDRIGLNADQFFQVVLLPQGAFATFLLAADDDREDLLRSLFDARRFTDVEGWFQQRRTSQRADVGIYQSRLAELIARAAQVAGLAEPPSTAAAEWFDQLTARAKERAELTAGDAERADHTLRTAEADVAEAEDLAKRQRRLQTALAARDKAESRRPEMERLRARVATAERARSVAPLLSSLRESEQTVRAAATAVTTRRDRLGAFTPDQARADQPTLRRWLQRAVATRGGLAQALADEQELVAARLSAAHAAAQLAEASATLSAWQEERATLPARIETTRAAAADARLTAAGRAELTTALQVLDKELAAARLTRTLTDVEAEAHHRLIGLVDAAQTAKERWLATRERRIDGMAAELATALEPDAACPVCGSRTHPSPAAPAGDAPSAQSERQAHLSADEADQQRAAAADSLNEVRQQLAAAQAAAAGQTEDSITARARACRERLIAMDRAEAELAELTAALPGMQVRLEALDGQIAAATAARDEHRIASARLQAEVEHRVARVARSLDGHSSVAARAKAVDAQILAGQALLDALDELAVADKTVRRAEAALSAEAERAGFLSHSDAAAAVMVEADLGVATARLRAHDDDDAASLAMLHAPDLRDLPQEPAAVSAAAQSLTLARGLSQAARAAADEAARAAGALERIGAQAAGVLEQAGPAVAALEEIDQLAGLLRGEVGNNRRMRLTSYVLAARLEQVAAAASDRLEIMSKGRYRLEHTDSRLNQRRVGGLGLVVLDAYTGTTRSTRTLSGGESFMASLALALGLAEVVTAEAGATTLESLFVDEGFGSLDTDTREVVMSTLDDLRAGGRAIGVISHVEELKTRIQSKLFLSRTASGSHIEAQVGDVPDTVAGAGLDAIEVRSIA